MDKRYLLIIIIIIVCCANLSIIVNNSDDVGSASVSIGKYLFSTPKDFSLSENNGNSAIINNEKNNMSIYVETELSDSDNYNRRLNYIENGTNDTILSKGTVSIEYLTVNSVYYKTTNNNNQSAFYFEKDNTPFKIVVSNFNYNNDRDLTLDYITFIIKSMTYDYKTGK